MSPHGLACHLGAKAIGDITYPLPAQYSTVRGLYLVFDPSSWHTDPKSPGALYAKEMTVGRRSR